MTLTLRGLAGVRLIVRAPMIALVLLCTTAWAGAHKPTSLQVPDQPEIASGYQHKQDVITHQFAVASANPLASKAGYDMLQAGGSAIDAAVAVQMVLGLVEPQSSGLGGGAFLLWSDGVNTQAFDGRETAPGLADDQLFLNDQGQPMPFYAAVVGGRAVGTPGTVKMLALAHQQHGQLAWARLFQPAIALAQKGFPISERLYQQLKADAYLSLDPVARAYFYQANGQPHPVGYLLRNPEYAQVLTQIAKHGPSAFYEGAVAQAIVQKVQQHPTNPGRLQLSDLKAYEPKVRQALCFQHQAAQRHLRICGFPPPSSGAITVGQIMGMMSHRASKADALQNGQPSVSWMHDYSEASRLAFADRALYIADPDFVPAPANDWTRLLNDDYLGQRAAQIDSVAMKSAPAAGVPPQATQLSWASMPDQIEHGTSHISIVDGQGQAIAMTTTIEDGFGSRQMVKGFLLNNELTDFSFVAKDASGRPVANRVEPFKRPRSSMSPTLVFDQDTGQLLMSVGSPGGSLIIHFTAKTLWGVWHWGLTPQNAIDLPNFANVSGPLLLETDRFDELFVGQLKARGHQVKVQDLTSGLQSIVRTKVEGRSAWISGADPRREGVVLGR